MRKTLASKIAILTLIYIAAFILVVILQFSNNGNFSVLAGGMTIKGRYKSQSARSEIAAFKEIAGGVRIFYAGLEFNLIDERGAALTLKNSAGDVFTVNPDYMEHSDNTARFILPEGTILTFNSVETLTGSELQITGVLSEYITEVIIPVIPRRSSVVREAGHLAVLFSGHRYSFSGMGKELDAGFISLTSQNLYISYRTRNKEIVFNPEDYIIEQVNNYDTILNSWLDSSFSYWNQNVSLLQSEDDIIAYLASSLLRGSYNAALANVPANFRNSTRQTYRSSVYVGGMGNAYNSFITLENEKINLITRYVRERSMDILKEENVLDWLHSRNNTALANDVLNFVNNIQAENLVIDHIAGLLEIYSNIKIWRPNVINPVDNFKERIIEVISEHLHRDTQTGFIYVSGFPSSSGDGGSLGYEYNTRLGLALINWAQADDNNIWADIGKSLVISVINEEPAASRGRLYSIHKPSNYLPAALPISNEGHWAWTVSPSINTSYINGDLNIAVSFPANMTHHLIIRGIQPFLSIQIHAQTWRSDPQFEIYDSSGWVYYQDQQVLVLKLRHQAAVENVRIVYRAPAPAPTPVPAPAPAVTPPAQTPAPTPVYVEEGE